MNNDKNLDSDEQGEKGQAQFRAICIDAKLTCNEAGRDRAGFDFIVNERIGTGRRGGLDKRPAPFSCLIQTKCIKASNDQIRLRLSSVEQIAKDSKPAFIYIFRVKPDGGFDKSVLIHLYGDVLAKILKKLRSEEAAGRFAVNHARISLSMGNGIEIEPTGKALRQHLTEACGNDPGQYASNKALALKDLGYGDKPYSLKMSLELSNIEEFIDVMLGVKTDVPAKILEQAETRFGITLQKDDLSKVAGSLTITPNESIPCGFVIRRDKFSDPIALRGDIVIAPSPKDLSKIGGLLFRCKIFTFVAKLGEEKFSINLNTIVIKDDLFLSSKEWLQLFRVIQAMRQDNFSIAIEPAGLKRLSLHKLTAMMSIEEDIVTFDVKNAEHLVRLVEMAGVVEDVYISFAAFCQQAHFISSGYALLDNQKELTPLSFEVDRSEQAADLPEIVDCLHVNCVVCRDEVIVWSAQVRLKKIIQTDRVCFESEEVNLVEISKIPTEEYLNFVEEARVKAGAGVLMARELDAPT